MNKFVSVVAVCTIATGAIATAALKTSQRDDQTSLTGKEQYCQEVDKWSVWESQPQHYDIDPDLISVGQPSAETYQRWCQ